MLILTRRPAETIYIGEEVTVTVLGVVGNQVRFGIDAPRSIVIDRAEIHERKKRAAELANGTPSGTAASGDASRDVGTKDDSLLAQADGVEPHEVNGNLAALSVRNRKGPLDSGSSAEGPVIARRSRDEINGNTLHARRDGYLEGGAAERSVAGSRSRR